MEYSKYQTAIFDFIANGTGNAQVIAPAGSGKTTTGVTSVSYIPRGMVRPNIVYLAFNKHIQEELARKLPEYAIAKTYHAFGLGAVQGKKPTITSYKNNDICQAHFGRNLSPIFPIISRVTSLFKSNLLNEVNHQSVNTIIDQYGIEMGEESDPYFDEIVEGVKICLDPSHVDRLNKMDFDDMIWYPIVMNLPLNGYDYILVDEAQDTNPAQTELVIRSKNGKGRVIAIGDPNQAIYGFAGAGVDSIDKLKTRLNAIELPLSITYRCPLAVVQFVNQAFPNIPFEAWDKAIEGSVNSTTEDRFFTQVLPGDMVLCRLNAPLVAPAMRLLREGKKAIIKGKDIGKNLIQLIHQIQKKFYPQNINEFLVDLDDYVAKESLKLRETQRFTQASLLEDKSETLMAFAEGGDSIGEMTANIEKIFADDIEGIVFSSVHKAKGLEADNVYILKPELLPFKRAKLAWQMQQEMNLFYVASTRAKVTLNFVNS
jgi:DNA helicase-2/ATP-dependent DNA helicase PcrA